MIRRICKRIVEVIREEYNWYRTRVWLQQRAVKWVR
jgi:cell fate regulator YaaT (PSP1 superfamily)